MEPQITTPSYEQAFLKSSEIISSRARMLKFLKEGASFHDAQIQSLPMDDGASLVPISKYVLSRSDLISKLTDWRNTHRLAFPTQFQATFESTRDWLIHHILENEQKILFFVQNQAGEIVGHLGLTNLLINEKAEIDNVIRGVKNVSPGLMSRALLRLILWAQEVLFVERLYLKVFSENTQAIRFYERCSFIQSSKIFLKKQEDRGKIRFVSTNSESFDASFEVMEYQPKSEPTSPILTAGPSISSKEVFYTYQAASYGWNSRANEWVDALEAKVSEVLGRKYAIATSSCTGAMHLALLALGISEGDEVLVPEQTWVATANVVKLVGATPVFVDIEPESLCMDPEKIEEKMTPKTKLIMPVHLYGHPANMKEIQDIATRRQLLVLEDAAPALGAFCKTKMEEEAPAGTLGDFAAFSFQGAKLTVSGEGGVLVTDKEELYLKAKFFHDQCRVPGTFITTDVGTKYKMSNVQAALALAQVERHSEFVQVKRRIFNRYCEGLSDIEAITMLEEAPWAKSTYWMSNMMLNETSHISVEELRHELKLRQIDTRPFFPVLSQYKMWQTNQYSPQAEFFSKRGLSLPSGVCLKAHEIDRVINEIRSIVQK